jgi:hypothetical protein
MAPCHSPLLCGFARVSSRCFRRAGNRFALGISQRASAPWWRSNGSSCVAVARPGLHRGLHRLITIICFARALGSDGLELVKYPYCTNWNLGAFPSRMPPVTAPRLFRSPIPPVPAPIVLPLIPPVRPNEPPLSRMPPVAAPRPRPVPMMPPVARPQPAVSPTPPVPARVVPFVPPVAFPMPPPIPPVPAPIWPLPVSNGIVLG